MTPVAVSVSFTSIAGSGRNSDLDFTSEDHGEETNDSTTASHDCSLHHVRSQSNWAMAFGDEDRQVKLTFKDSGRYEEEGFKSYSVVDIGLSGSAYLQLREQHCGKPPLEDGD